jgi:hypothetical protein
MLAEARHSEGLKHAAHMIGNGALPPKSIRSLTKSWPQPRHHRDCAERRLPD